MTRWTVGCQAPLFIGFSRLLEWVAVSFSRGSSWPRDRTPISCTAGRFFTDWAIREAPEGWGQVWGLRSGVSTKGGLGFLTLPRTRATRKKAWTAWKESWEMGQILRPKMGSNEKPVFSLMYHREMCGHCQAGRITGSSLLVLLFPFVPPKAPCPLQIPILRKKNYFWREKWDESLPFLPPLVLWGLNPHLSGTSSHPLTSSFNINIYTLPWWLTGHTNLRFFFNAKKFHCKEKCMMLSTFAPIILKIAWHFITPASLGRLFDLSGHHIFERLRWRTVIQS